MGLGGGRPVRHRAPCAAQRAAQAGPGCAELFEFTCAAQHPPGHRAAAVGVARDRGLARRPVAMYTKLHHPLVDGVSAMRLLQSILSSDPDERDMLAPWAKRPPGAPRSARHRRPPTPVDGRDDERRARTALGISVDAAGIPKALIKTLNRSLRNETSTLSLSPPTPSSTARSPHRDGSPRRTGRSTHPRDRQGHRHHAQRRRAGDVQRRMRTYLSELDAPPTPP